MTKKQGDDGCLWGLTVKSPTLDGRHPSIRAWRNPCQRGRSSPDRHLTEWKPRIETGWIAEKWIASFFHTRVCELTFLSVTFIFLKLSKALWSFNRVGNHWSIYALKEQKLTPVNVHGRQGLKKTWDQGWYQNASLLTWLSCGAQKHQLDQHPLSLQSI